MSERLQCWRCGADLRDVPQPFGRRATCIACRAELHVCRMCRHFDTGKAKQCRERAADEVGDKTRANFCDWFQPRIGTPVPGKPPVSDARAALDKLFGD